MAAVLHREDADRAARTSDTPAPSFLDAARRAIERAETAVASFDVFDTLLKRRAATPVAFFEVIGSRLAREGWLLPHVSPAQFRAQRVAAEHRARGRMQAAAGHPEVRLADIWQELVGILAPGMAPEEAAEAEFAIERDHIFGNAPVLDLLALAQRWGRRVVLVSDTYFTAGQVAQMLRRATRGRDDIDPGAIRVFASCERGTGKGAGLFDLVLRELGAHPTAVVHLGDNWHADVDAAAKRGIQAMLLPNGTTEGWEILAAEERYRPHGARPLPAPDTAPAEGEITSLRNAALLHGASPGVFDHFAFGSFVLGPILHQYLRWAERILTAMGGDAIACGLLREGGFLAELLAERLPGRKVVALGISRLAMARAALTEVTAETLAAALPTRHAIPFATFAERLGLSLTDFPRCYWTQSLSTRDGPLVEEIVAHILAEPALTARIAAEAAAFRVRMARHVAAVLGGEVAAGRSCLLLDVGWAGSIQERLIRVFGLPSERLTGLYLALNDRGLARCVEGGLRAAGFLFDGPEAHRLAGPGMRFVEILEQATTPPRGSVLDYDEQGAPIFGADPVPAAQRAERAEVQRGILSYIRHAARHHAADGGAADLEAGRVLAQAIFLRASLAPTDPERRLFTGWVHDDSFADGALDALVPVPHRRIAPYMTPAQLAGAAFLYTYWPYGTLDADSRHLAEQAALAQLHGGRFDLFARTVPLGLEVAPEGGPGWALGRFAEVALNAFNRFAVELEAAALAGEGLLLRLRPARPGLRLALEVACFAQAGGVEQDRQVVALDAATLAGLLRDGDGEAPPSDGAFALRGEETVLRLRLPEQVLLWRGRIRIALGFHLQDRPGAAGQPAAAAVATPEIAAQPEPKGWFDSLLGAKTPLAAGEIPLDAAATMLTSHGWVLDAAGWRGPDAVQLVLEGGAETRRFEAELYSRPDISRGFRRAVRGLTGCRCRVPVGGLPPGRFEVAWEARFGEHVVHIRAPYAVTLERDEAQRPRLSVEVTGRIHYA